MSVVNTRQSTKTAERKRRSYKDKYLSLFSMLFNNSVEVENIPDKLPKRYLLRNLLMKGAIAYDKQTELFLPFVYSEIDVYGLPKRYQLYGYNGFNVWRNVDEVVILRANDISFGLYAYFEQQAEKLVDLDLSIEQNLNAIKVTSVVRVNDKSTLLSLANAENARQVGSMVIYVDKNLQLDSALTQANTGATYLVDKLQQARQIVLNETLSTIGISVANTDKRERVQTTEVLASQGYAMDCLQTLIDTFNYDAEVGGLSIRLKANTFLSEKMQNMDLEGATNNEE